jgi:trypsin
MVKLSPGRGIATAVAVTALLALVGLSGAIGAGAASAPRGERIIAGTTADPAEWPFAAALYIRSARLGGRVLDCSASVIAPRYVLTAAHCAIGESARRFSVIVGRPNLADTSVGEEIPVRKTKVNPLYGPPNFRADVAILVLSRPTSVPPVALPSVAASDAATVPGSVLYVAGWGGTRPSGRHTSKPLLTTGETVLKGAPCKRSYGGSFSSSTTICTQGAKLAPPQSGHAGSCYGDSGGPLVADTPSGRLLVGAVSGGGLRCGTSPDYYARISANLKFIEKATGVTPASP